MNRSTIDLWVGIFVTIGVGAIVFLALKVGNLTSLNAQPTYRLEARFDNIGGLMLRSPVKAAGVVAGMEGYWSPLTWGFFYGDLVAVLLIVTAVVHVTGGAVSGFAALYILVNASASLLLPIGGTLLVALLGLVMYGADAVYVARGAGDRLDLEIFVQIGVVSLVAVIRGSLSGRPRGARRVPPAPRCRRFAGVDRRRAPACRDAPCLRLPGSSTPR